MRAHLGGLAAVAIVSGLLACVACVACGHGAGPALPRAEGSRAPLGAPASPPQYIVADPSHEDNVLAVPLGAAGALGLVVDKTRIVVGRGEPRLGEGVTEEAIAGAARIPQRLGGGFLFWTESSLYRSGSFEGVLEPIAKTPDPIVNISFAPKFLLVRSRNGERWALGLPKGERVALDPLGAVDVEGLDDGRALAFDDQGLALSSTDGGAHWVDVTTQLKNTPVRVAVVDDEIWFFENNNTATRLEPDGQLSFFDKEPAPKTQILRTPDPRWRGQDAPLRTVFRAGASIDESTALVVEQGDLVRVDVHTGEITSVVSGKLPPESSCEAVPTPNDVLFACIVHTSSTPGLNSAFVVSHTLAYDTPVVEQTFAGGGAFWASDDGGLAYAGPCNGTTPGPQGVCVRQPGGSWQDVDLSTLSGDAGPTDVTLQRWVPRGDGRAVAILLDPAPQMFDPRTGALVAIDPSARDALSPQSYGTTARARRRIMQPYRNAAMGRVSVDSSWSFSPTGSLRGWSAIGGAIEISDDGKVTRSPYTFEIVSSGPNGLGRTDDGRTYQSADHGASWTEVAAPPSGAAAGDLRGCSSAGCDLGGFYRVGWATRPPRVDPPASIAKPAPEVRRTRPVEMACRPSGPVVSKTLPRTDSSPEDLGLGVARLPAASEHTELGYVRVPFTRGIVFPIRDGGSSDPESSSLRAMLSGYGTTQDNGTIEVTGPNKSPSALRRTITFLPAFDPLVTPKKGTIAMSEVISAGRIAGMSNDDILQDDMTESGTIAVMTPHDPLSASDLVFHNPRGLIAFVHANERVKISMRASADDAMIVSGVALGGDEAAFLELDATGIGHVFRMSGSTTTELFDVNPNATDASLYPANPDALAVGPKGELGLIRTGSGSDPASANDPAILIVQQSPALALAPWSTLRFADDPACKEPGFRATLQVIAPWIRMTTPELHTTDAGPMLARVKWNEKRVCLEGVEMRLPEVSVRVPTTSGTDTIKPTSWLVSRGSQFARVAITEGIEWRQPLECTLKP